tara:strand:- start:506 stop:790 length:285 start_codon:yes stop_codon:yes gene_type:complete
MKILIALIMTAMITMAPAEEPEYMKGEVIEFVKQTDASRKSGKSVVVVWNGKKEVKVTLPTQFLRIVEEGKIFPFRIHRDPRTKEYASHGKRPF